MVSPTIFWIVISSTYRIKFIVVFFFYLRCVSSTRCKVMCMCGFWRRHTPGARPLRRLNINSRSFAAPLDKTMFYITIYVWREWREFLGEGGWLGLNKNQVGLLKSRFRFKYCLLKYGVRSTYYYKIPGLDWIHRR